MLSEIFQNLTEAGYVKNYFDNLISVYNVDKLSVIENIISDSLKERLGTDKWVSALNLPNGITSENSLITIDSIPIEFIDGFSIFSDNIDQTFLIGNESIKDIKEIIVFKGNKIGDFLFEKGKTNAPVESNEDETVIMLDSLGNYVSIPSENNKESVYLKLGIKTIEVSNLTPTLIPEGYSYVGSGFSVDSSNKLKQLSDINLLNPYTSKPSSLHEKNFIFLSNMDNSYYKDMIGYSRRCGVDQETIIRRINKNINELKGSINTDLEAANSLDMIKGEDFGLYSSMLEEYYKKSEGIINLDDLNIIHKNSKNKIINDYDLIGGAITPKLIVSVFNPERKKVQLFFNGRLVNDYLESPGGQFTICAVNITKLYPELSSLSHNSDAIVQAYNNMDKSNDTMVSKLKRNDYETYVDVMGYEDNGFIFLPEGYYDGYQKQIYLNGILLDYLKDYEIDTNILGEKVILLKRETNPGDDITIAYYKNPISLISKEYEWEALLERQIKPTDEIYIGGLFLGETQIKHITSSHLMSIIRAKDESGNNYNIKVISSEQDDNSSLLMDDFRYKILKENEPIKTWLESLAMASITDIISKPPLFNKKIYDIHKFYTLYLEHGDVNSETQIEDRFHNLILPYLDANGVLSLDCNEGDNYPRMMRLPSGVREIEDKIIEYMNKYIDLNGEINANDVIEISQEDFNILGDTVIETNTNRRFNIQH